MTAGKTERAQSAVVNFFRVLREEQRADQVAVKPTHGGKYSVFSVQTEQKKRAHECPSDNVSVTTCGMGVNTADPLFYLRCPQLETATTQTSPQIILPVPF